MQQPLDRDSLLKELRELDFVAPIAEINFTVNNPEYDIESYSEELDMLHQDWVSPDDDGPMFWLDCDYFGVHREEPEDHKIWRLNHNKKYETMDVSIFIEPKKVGDWAYALDDDILEMIVERLKSMSVYSVFT